MDHAILPPTPKQVDFARAIATRLKLNIPPASANDRRALSEWISVNHKRMTQSHRRDSARGSRASAKQVALAERLAKRRRTQIPPDCFQDAKSMSRWIDRLL